MGHRLFWMLIAILLPEVVLFCAWEQWWAARRLKKEIDKIGDDAFNGKGIAMEEEMEEECHVCARERLCDDVSDLHLDMMFDGVQDVEENSTTGVDATGDNEDTKPGIWSKCLQNFRVPIKHRQKEHSTWNMEQAFFALIGGYAIESPLPNPPPPKSKTSNQPSPYLTLTVPGILFLAFHGLLPNTAPTAIADKSKADYVAKTLVCIQAAWFMLQCIGRTAQKLPLTLLEIHVLAHVLCAFAMYFLWVDKPYDVGSPIVVEGDRVRELGALWALDGGASPKHKPSGSVQECVQTRTSRIHISQVQTVHSSPPFFNSRRHYLNILFSYFHDNPIPQLEKLPASQEISTPTPAELTHLELANGAVTYLKTRNVHFLYTDSSTNYLKPPSSQPPTDDDEDPTTTTTLAHTHIAFPTAYLVQTRSNLLLDGMSNFTSDSARFSHLTHWMKTYAVLGACYGGLHLAAWDFDFATNGEKWSWRVSGIAMLVAPVATVFGILGFGLQSYVLGARRRKRAIWSKVSEADKTTPPGRWVRLKRILGRWFQSCLFGCGDGVAMVLVFMGFLVALVAWVVYPIARVYVLVESFAGLRSVEKEVYRTVEWSGFVPHVG